MTHPTPRTLRERAVAQLLHRPAGLTAAGAVRHLLAVQAQDARSARLALRARLGTTPAIGEDLVVTWLMRGTLHLVHRDDLPWLHAITAPRAMTASDRRLHQLGVMDAVARVRAALPFTRAEAGEALGLTGQAVPHAIHRAALEGYCVGDLDGHWVAASIEPVDREAALQQLVERFVVAHPGADLARWAGIPKRDVRPADAPPVEPRRTGPRLLPAFDPLTIAYAADMPGVFAGGGMFRAAAVLDGELRGTWTMPRGRVVFEPPSIADEFAGEAAALS